MSMQAVTLRAFFVLICAVNNIQATGVTFDWRDLLHMPPLPAGKKLQPSPQVLHFYPLGKSVWQEESTARYITEHMQAVKIVESDADNMRYAVDSVQVKEGAYLEFGVCTGRTINFIAALAPRAKVHGFDSFKGLPIDWPERNMAQGTFAFKDEAFLPPVLNNVVLHVGLFDQTLPEFVQDVLKAQPIALLHVDSDIYESAKTIFTCLKHNIVPGTIIVFDEYFNYPGWEKHEFKAFQEFIADSGLSYEYIAYNEMHEQVTVRIK